MRLGSASSAFSTARDLLLNHGENVSFLVKMEKWTNSVTQGFVSQCGCACSWPDPKGHAACGETPALPLAPASFRDGVKGDLQNLNPSVTAREKVASCKQELRK